MRNYAQISPSFWVFQSGRAFKQAGCDAQVLALYVISAPTSDMYGLYYLPRSMMMDAATVSEKRLTSLLALFADLDFARYDLAREYIWVIEMARWQLNLTEPLKPGDRRITHANNWYRSLPKNAFLGAFYDRYAGALSLAVRRESEEPPLPQPEMPTRAMVKASVQPTLLDLFERWWKAYPKKVGKRAAMGEWLKIHPAPTEEFTLRAIALLQQQTRSPDWTKEGGQFIPDPERYLKKGRYLDEPRDVPHLAEHEAKTANNLLNWVNS